VSELWTKLFIGTINLRLIGILTGYSTRVQRAEAKRAGAFDSTYDPKELFELIFKAAPNKDK
jgi:hypothetical protein